MKLQFNTNGNEKQKLATTYWIDKETIDIVYGGAKGSGKSYLGVSLIFGDALIYSGTMYFIARKSLNDLRKFTIPSIHEVFDDWGLTKGYYKFNGQDNYYHLYNGSTVYLLEAKYMPSDEKYERFGSMQMTRGWIEEAGEFSINAKNNLFASVGRWKNEEYGLKSKLLQTCNPSKNYLYKEYYKKFKENSIENWKKFVQALPSDNKKLPKDYIENLLKVLTKNEKERLIFGNWEYDDDPAVLIEYDKIIDIYSNDFVDGGKKYIIADIARFGKDKTLIGLWDGFRLINLKKIDRNKVTEAADEINKMRKLNQVPLSNILVDEDGVGGGVVDILNCKGFVNNSRPLPVDGKIENYDNLKSQCAFRFAKRVNDNGYYVNGVDEKDKEMITEECEQIKKNNIDKDGKQSIVPKDKVKQIIGRSPDYSDMLIMREWFELQPRPFKGHRIL